MDTKSLWEQNIHLAYLQSGYTLKVVNIQVTQGQGKLDGNAFSHVSNVLYDVLDSKESCMVSMPSTFLLGYDTHKNYANPLTPIIKTIEYLQNRISEIDSTLPDSNGIFLSEVLKVTTEGDFTTITIFQDTWTLANLISRYVYDLDPEIAYITADIEHPDKDVSVIKINHPDVMKIVHNALARIKKDLTSALSQITQ
jgi:DNA-directed RNA polymerase subunit L